MSDNVDDVEVQVDDPGIEIAIGAEPEAQKPEVVSLSPAEYAALKAQGDSAKAIQDGIANLASGLRPQPQAQTANTPIQSPEEFFSEHSDDIFDKEKGAKIMAEFTKRVAERDYGPTLAAQAFALSEAKKELLESRDPLFKKYKREVEDLVSTQPPNVRMQPDIYDRAWLTIKQKHSIEIEEESVKSKVDAAVEAKLKELGIDVTKARANANPRPAAYENSASRSSNAGSINGNGKRIIRLPDEATKQKFEREAARRGLELEDYLKIKGY
jgi:hypothetical protein